MNRRNNTHENKTSHRLSEQNYVKTITWMGVCESQDWIWWPEGSFQGCFPWRQYLKPYVPSLMLQKRLHSSHRIAFCWASHELRWAIGWNLLVPLSVSVLLADMWHWDISPNSGQLVKNRAVYCCFELWQLFSFCICGLSRCGFLLAAASSCVIVVVFS